MDLKPKRRLKGAGVWEHFTVRDGLPDMKIECLFEDSRGMLWISTHDRGVARFDGDRFDVFTAQDGLPSDNVFSILEDRESVLWFGTAGGLTRYDGRMFQAVDLPSRELLWFLWGSCEDRQGRLWFGIGRRPGSPPSVCQWDGEQLTLIPLTDRAVRESSDISCVVVDARGELWFGGDGLYRYDEGIFHYLEEVPDATGVIWSLLPREDGSLWIGANKGLFIYREGTLQSAGEEFVGHRVRALAEGSSGTLWLTFAGDDRVICYEDGSLRDIGNLGAGLWGNLCLDRLGRLWTGTYGKGLYCYDTSRFEIFGREHGLGSQKVWDVSEDEEGKLLVGTFAGLMRYDGHAFEPVEVSEEQIAQLEQANAHPFTVKMDSRHRLWFGRAGRELYVVEKDGAVYLVLQVQHAGSRSLLVEDMSGRVWFGFPHGTMISGRERGFGYYEDGHVRFFPSGALEDCPPRVGALLVDREGVVWIGSSYPGTWDGLCRYDGESFSAFTSVDGLAGGGVFALCEDREGYLWIGTTQGVSRYDGERFETFTRSDGLPDGTIRAIAQTEDGKLWFGTEGGEFCCHNGQVFQMIRMPENTGCDMIGVIHQDRAGRIWFGTDGGLVGYTPQRIPPEAAIIGVLADRTYEPSETIEIPTTAGRVGFRFQGRSPAERSSRLVYRYRLEGYDKKWRQTRERHVEYSHLSPGSYRFSVQAIDSDLNYSEAKTVRIAVVPDPRVVGLTEALRSSGASGEFVGQSLALHKILFQIQDVAQTDMTVLVVGETGTGKGLVSRAIHGMGEQREGPFIPVNCGAIPEGLVESELFGYERGAFTGAVTRKLGKVELATEGTLFLDEIGDLPLLAQGKLLRFLEEHAFERVGGEETLRVDVRVVAATNRDLEQMVAEERFREDLYYRLRTFVVQVPPLRERREDIPLLAQYFAERFAAHLNRPVPEIDPEVAEHFQRHTWPGNVRELEHLVQRAVLSCSDHLIRMEDVVGGEIQDDRPAVSGAFSTLEELERRHIERALEATGWTIYGESGAARLLGIHPENLRVRMRKHGLRRPR